MNNNNFCLLKKTISICLVMLFFLSCSSEHVATDTQTNSPSKAQSPNQPTESTHWSYAGSTGPSYWGNLSSDYTTCKNGTSQSPIDLVWSKPQKGKVFDFQYISSNLRLIDNGHSIQINISPGSKLYYEGREYILTQIHFHSQSEHTFSGHRLPIEAHLVHKDLLGQTIVAGVVFREGKSNPFIANIWPYLPKEKGKNYLVKGLSIDPVQLLPSVHTHYYYTGSLTTPPCTEGVQWIVFNTPAEMTKEQIETFRRFYSDNSRPTQPLNQRKPTNH